MILKINNLFLPVFALWYSTEIFFNTTLESFLGIPISQLNNAVNYMILLLLLVQIVCFQTYKKKEAIIIVLISVIIIITALKSTNFALLSGWMFVIASRKTDFEKTINVAYNILRIMIPLIIACCFLGWVDDYTIIRNDFLRHSLGFVHPNQLGLRMFQLTACYLYLRRDRHRFVHFLIPFAFMGGVYLIPNSQTSYICITILTLLLLFFKWSKKYSSIIFITYGKALILFAILFNILSVSWSLINVNQNRILHQIDLIVSRRFSACYKVFRLYGISLLGQRVYISEEERRVVGVVDKLFLDNGYMALLLRYGIVAYCIFSVCYFFTMIYLRKKNQYYLLTILFVYALYGVMENGVYMVTHNIFLILFGNLLYQKVLEPGNSEIDNCSSIRYMIKGRVT